MKLRDDRRRRQTIKNTWISPHKFLLGCDFLFGVFRLRSSKRAPSDKMKATEENLEERTKRETQSRPPRAKENTSGWTPVFKKKGKKVQSLEPEWFKHILSHMLLLLLRHWRIGLQIGTFAPPGLLFSQGSCEVMDFCLSKGRKEKKKKEKGKVFFFVPLLKLNPIYTYAPVWRAVNGNHILLNALTLSQLSRGRLIRRLVWRGGKMKPGKVEFFFFFTFNKCFQTLYKRIGKNGSLFSLRRRRISLLRSCMTKIDLFIWRACGPPSPENSASCYF